MHPSGRCVASLKWPHSVPDLFSQVLSSSLFLPPCPWDEALVRSGPKVNLKTSDHSSSSHPYQLKGDKSPLQLLSSSNWLIDFPVFLSPCKMFLWCNSTVLRLIYRVQLSPTHWCGKVIETLFMNSYCTKSLSAEETKQKKVKCFVLLIYCWSPSRIDLNVDRNNAKLSTFPRL